MPPSARVAAASWGALLLLAGCSSSPAATETQAPRSPARSETEPIAAPEPADPRLSCLRTPPWAAAMPALVFAPATDVMHGEMEVSLLPFFHDPDAVPAAAYDGCRADGACPARRVEQAAEAPAVGMTWDAAQAFCATRGMRTQSAPQDIAMRRGSDRPVSYLRGADPSAVVVQGFRCTLDAQACETSAP